MRRLVKIARNNGIPKIGDQEFITDAHSNDFQAPAPSRCIVRPDTIVGNGHVVQF
jgi:hypothetical protein